MADESSVFEALEIAIEADALKLATRDIPRAITAARQRLTVAADYHRDTELARSITRLNGLYETSLNIQDTKTALSTQKELNKVLGLYPQPAAAPQATPQAGAPQLTGAGNAQVIEGVRLHLVGVFPDVSTPDIVELARLAVLHIIDLQGRVNRLEAKPVKAETQTK